jgi:hypothetical protein
MNVMDATPVTLLVADPFSFSRSACRFARVSAFERF